MKHLNKAELKEFYEQQRNQNLMMMNERLQQIRKRERIRMQYLTHLDPERIRSRHLKKLTILHSNDLHGDFLAEEIDTSLIGGVSMLSGYIARVRNEEQNVIYAIAGDMFRGSLIDSEFRGISTIEIMNLLTPDVVTVGNHEVDAFSTAVWTCFSAYQPKRLRRAARRRSWRRVCLMCWSNTLKITTI